MSKQGNVSSSEELARYSRQIRLPEMGMAGQQRLKAARVLLIGTGGLGSPAALYLAAAGVGTLGLADFDRVELHNLQRQILHDTASVGQCKLESARQRLAALNPCTEIVLHHGGVQPDNAVALFSQYDIVVDGADNFPTRYLANDAAYFARVPLVHGSVLQFEGQVTVFDPWAGGPCYRCLFPQMPEPGAVPNCAEAGVLGALCGMVGSAMAMEVIKHIAGVGEPLRGRLLVMDVLRGRVRTVAVKRDDACPLCGHEPTLQGMDPARYVWACEPPAASAAQPLEVEVEEAAAWLRSEAGALLLDVREPYETGICKIAGALLIPMGQVSSSLHALPRDRRLLVCCHHGGRSMKVTRLLREKGFPLATNIAGGVDAWALRMEPGMQRY